MNQELTLALQAVADLLDELDREIFAARAFSRALRHLDSDPLFAEARRRERFHRRLADLERALAERLEVVARHFHLRDLTIASLRAAHPQGGAKLEAALAEVRDRAAKLREEDGLNRFLAERAQRCVDGYLRALTTPPSTYDRRGFAAAYAVPSVSTARRVL